MFRSLAVFALLALPLPASASVGDGGVPLRTLCSSPTMSNCMSIWAWDFVWTPEEVEGSHHYWRITGTADIEVFGSGYPEEEFFVAMMFAYHTEVDDGVMLVRRLDAPGRYVFSQNDAPFLVSLKGDPYLVPNIEPTPSSIYLANLGGELCYAEKPCYEPVSVPEPASMLLLATGIGGVAWMRRRREGCL